MNRNTLEDWHKAAQARNPKLLDDLLADDVVFHSPVVHTPQAGKAITKLYLAAAMQVLGNQGFRYLREVVGERDAVLEFATELDGIQINGVDMIRWNDDGRIVDFKVMVRPLKAVNLLHQKMGEMLQTIEDPNPVLNRQMAEWIRSGDLYVNGINVSHGVARARNPLLVVLANADGIVPDPSALSAHELMESEVKDVLRVGTDAVRVAHADLFISEISQKWVFEPLAEWLINQNLSVRGRRPLPWSPARPGP